MQRATIRCTLLRPHVLAATSPQEDPPSTADCGGSRFANNVINGIPGQPLDAQAAFHAAATFSCIPIETG